MCCRMRQKCDYAFNWLKKSSSPHQLCKHQIGPCRSAVMVTQASLQSVKPSQTFQTKESTHFHITQNNFLLQRKTILRMTASFLNRFIFWNVSDAILKGTSLWFCPLIRFYAAFSPNRTQVAEKPDS